jgi:acyl transferase domain-containing protein
MGGYWAEDRRNDLAIIGWSVRLPDADKPERYWRNIIEKKASVSFFTEEEVVGEGIDPRIAHDSEFVKARAILAGIDLFDAEFFGYSPREVEIMDPQQRLFLEVAWQALEDGGYARIGPEGARIGVFGSSSMSSYLFSNVIASGQNIDPFHALLGNDRSHLATRVAYKLNLNGPAVNIQTACSASLVAFHYGCQSLLAGECDLALVGGVSITVPQKSGHQFQPEGIYSPDGHCRAFDADAHGIVGGNGAAVVLLKRMADAVSERDTIHAVVRGSAVNNDGAVKVGYTAPSVEGQVGVISEAMAMADVSPEAIGYVEAHGTGTPIGDPIEIEALSRVYRMGTQRRGYCGIGSVKSNIGHLDAAAGLAGLVKSAMALKTGTIPPTLHVRRPNPAIDFAASPFYVATEAKPWPRGAAPRLAGVSAFGLGGSNAHVVLEEPPARTVRAEPPRSELVVLSARNPDALQEAGRLLGGHLALEDAASLGDVAYTLQVGRKRFQSRGFAVARSSRHLVELLERDRVRRGKARAGEARRVAFAFPGLGDQFPGMGGGLYRTEAVYREVVDRNLARLAPHFDQDLHHALFGGEAGSEERRFDFRAMVMDSSDTGAVDPASELKLQHPFLFVTELALARLFFSWGIQPDATLGYSLGEITAACVAGVFDEEDALEFVRQRAAIIAELPAGAAVTVQTDEATLREILPDGAAIAGENAPGIFTVAGSASSVAALEETLERSGIPVRRVATRHAFHTPAMLAAQAKLASLLEGIRMSPPDIPMLSNTSGSWADPEQIATPGYWLEHLVQPVRFADALQTLADEPSTFFLELGPGRSLSGWARRTHREMRCHSAFGHRYEKADAREQALVAVGALWLEGLEPDWEAMHVGRFRGRVPLPTYPFERKRFWLAPAVHGAAVRPSGTDSEARRPDLSDWFYVPCWSRIPLTPWSRSVQDASRGWLIIGGGNEAEAIASELERHGCAAVVVRTDECRAPSHGVIWPAATNDFLSTLQRLQHEDHLPGRIAILDAGATDGAIGDTADRVRHSVRRLTDLARAVAESVPAEPIEITVVTSGGHEVESGDLPQPDQCVAAALRLIVPQEHSNQRWRVVDFDPGDARLSVDLAAELTADSEDTLVAYRGGLRWTQSYCPLHLPTPGGDLIREGGTYLILGSLGRIGLTLARRLGQAGRINLVLAGELGFDEKTLRASGTSRLPAHLREPAKVLREILATGSQLRIIDTDLGIPESARAVVSETLGRAGRIDGVIYAPGTAGLDGLSPVAETDGALIDWHVKGKLRPLLALAPELVAAKPDFVISASSLSPVLGGLGLGAHAAVHAAVDGLVSRINRQGHPWMTVNWNWADWSRASGAAAAGAPDIGATVRQYEIDDEEGAETFFRAITLGATSQVVVSSGGLERRIAQWSAAGRVQARSSVRLPSKAAPDGREGAGYPRPEVSTPFVAVQGPEQEMIAHIWCNALGLSEVGARDNFFELGGHSLLGAQVISEIRKAFGLNISLKTVFADATVEALANAVQRLEAQDERAMNEALHGG